MRPQKQAIIYDRFEGSYSVNLLTWQLIVSHSPNFTEHAQREIARRSQASFQTLGPGLFKANFQVDPGALIKHWRYRPPIYLHHVFPVQGAYRSLKKLAHGLRNKLKRHSEFQVQLRELNSTLGNLNRRGVIERELSRSSGAVCITGAPTVVSIVQIADVLYCGVSQLKENVSPWSGGAPPLSPDLGRLNRAEPKLAEALEVFGLFFNRGRALDLGSSVGGWSRHLLSRGLEVTAVDPKRPDSSLLAFAQFTHRAVTAEQYLPLAEGPYQLITNDMIMWPADSARLMLDYWDFLAPGGWAILTLKCGDKKSRTNIDHALRLLRKRYKIPRLKQLYTNGKEITALLRRPKETE